MRSWVKYFKMVSSMNTVKEEPLQLNNGIMVALIAAVIILAVTALGKN